VKRVTLRALAVAGAAVVLAGCSGDMSRQLMSNPEMQAKVMDLISQNGAMAGRMVEKLLASDSTRTVLLDKLMSNGAAVQGVLGRVAASQTMVDGVLNLAVQDTVMKSHLMGVLQGMKMVSR